MALKKTIALPTGVTADYFRLVSFRWDRNEREASALFALFKDAATASVGRPLVPVAAKLRLNGPGFDDYLSPSALAEAEQDVVGQLYLAAKNLSAAYAANGETGLDSHIACDFGQDVFDGAVDV